MAPSRTSGAASRTSCASPAAESSAGVALAACRWAGAPHLRAGAARLDGWVLTGPRRAGPTGGRGRR
eukprot:10897511-Lingulodinium_polyedra.AAC.1